MADTTAQVAEDVQSEVVKETVKAPVRNNVSGGVDIKDLLNAGAHFGHKTSRWHPKMAPYIHSKRNGSHIIDLVQTVDKLETALDFIEKTASQGKQVLIVGTKRQVHDIALQLAGDTNMPFVVERWLGGMLTNYNTINVRIKHLKDLETRMENGEIANKYNKLEVQRFAEEIEFMNHQYGGIKDMAAKLGAVFIFDPNEDKNAVLEATKLGVPTIALTDTNTDPSVITYPIPCNDDAIKTLQLISDYVKNAIETGRAKGAKPADKTEVVVAEKIMPSFEGSEHVVLDAATLRWSSLRGEGMEPFSDQDLKDIAAMRAVRHAELRGEILFDTANYDQTSVGQLGGLADKILGIDKGEK